MRILLLLCGLLSTACTERNAGRCIDQVCTDPGRPYCDVDGVVLGEPNVCIAADCTPNAFAACRGDLAVTCNQEATNYTEIQCQLGCSETSAGCRECTMSDQCVDARPVCDEATSLCRGCTADDECSSRVCETKTGTCVPEASIVYASPDVAGNVVGTCTRAQPCSLTKALMTALFAPVTPVLRLLPGTYTTGLTIEFPTSSTLHIVGTGATIATSGSMPAIHVTKGGNVAVRGLGATSSYFHVVCGAVDGSGAQAKSTLTIEDSTFTSVGNARGISVSRCDVDIRRSKLSLADPAEAFVLFKDAMLTADRLDVRGSGLYLLVFISSERAHARFSNSLLMNLLPNVGSNDTTAPGSSLTFVNDTIIVPAPWEFCDQPPMPFFHVAFENSIVAGRSDEPALRNPSYQTCSFTGSGVIWPLGNSPPLHWFADDPQFVGPALPDFHLQPTSIGIDAAVQGLFSSSEDLDGKPRPLGRASDLGAYER